MNALAERAGAAGNLSPHKPLSRLSRGRANGERKLEEVSKVLLGAVIAFVATLLSERWKRTKAGKAAAMMIVRELDYHRVRLNMASAYDEVEQAQYQMNFPSSVWSAQGVKLVAGASARQAAAVADWYALMALLGNSLGRQIGPEGPTLIGPDRERLRALLAAAHAAAERLSARWSPRKRRMPSPSLIDDLIEDAAGRKLGFYQ